MTATATALLGFIVWAILLTFVLLGVRFAAVGRGMPLNGFAADGRDLDAFGLRVTRALANCLENLAIVAGALLYAIATGQTAVTDGLALIALAARIGQSLTHMASTSVPAVLVRATLFSVQVLAVLYWIWGFTQAA